MDTILQNIIAKENIENCTIQISDSSKKGDGFIATLLRIKLIGSNKALNLIAKTAPESADYRRQIPVQLLYLNEMYFYEQIWPVFLKVQLENSVKNPFVNVPKFYGAVTTEYKELIILEDLLDCKYTMWNTKDLMDSAHIELVLKEYGRFHALSFALKKQRLELWKLIVEKLDDVPGKFFSGSDFTEAVVEQCEHVESVLVNAKLDNLAKRLKNFRLKSLEQVMNDSSRYSDEFSIILHGDSWCNNIMFQYDKNKENLPKQLKFIDFQVVRIGSVVLDLSYLLYTCLKGKELSNLDHYLNVYYQSLSEHLKNFGINVEQVFSYKEFLIHWQKFSTFGLAMTLVVLHGMCSDNSEFPDAEKVFSSGKGFFKSLNFRSVNEDFYNRRIIDIVQHFVDRNYL